MTEFKELEGKTLIRIEYNGATELRFYTSDGIVYRMYHYQDCCEQVTIEDVVGDFTDIIHSRILLAEVRSSKENPKHNYEDSFTWTFYELRTVKAGVTIRWYGSSNGYYSEEVSFEKYETTSRNETN